MLNYLNGVNNTNMNGILDKLTTLKNNAIQKLPPVIKTAIDTGGKVAQIGVKIATTPMRLAFLALVRVNALHVAENLEKGIRTNRTMVLNWWKDFGGDFNELLEVTNLGIKAGESGKASKLTGSLGDPVTVAAATATAVPVTTSLIALLKKIGVEAVTGTAKALADQGKTALTNAITKGINLPTGVTPAVVVSTPKAPTTEATTEKKSNMPLIIGGIAVLGIGAFFLLKKKK